MKKLIIDNQSDLFATHALDTVKLHLTHENQFLDVIYGDKRYVSVRHENKLSVRYSIYKQP